MIEPPSWADPAACGFADTYYCDFHIHIGRSAGKPVKMAASPSLTLDHVLAHARQEKGLDIITVIDGACTGVLSEITALIEQGSLAQLPDGGLRHENGLTVLLGAEVEVAGPQGGAAHFGCWFGSVAAAREFSAWLHTVQKNPSLSSQRARVTARQLQGVTRDCGGLFVVHHAFTPHKGLYGNCVSHLHEMVDPQAVDALELGLSADTNLADCLSELEDCAFVSNSDAHSVPKIAREYNALSLHQASFGELVKALHATDGRRITANYGLNPLLGKYHRTFCRNCGTPRAPQATACACGSTRFVQGVWDRLQQIRDRETPLHPAHRPPYIHQIPLDFIPGVGPAVIRRLLGTFGTEMNVLHRTSIHDLEDVVGERLAARIELARTGQSVIDSGGGGIYGKLRAGS